MHGGRRANAAIEFALTMPILLLLVGGVIDYGLLLDQLLDVKAACREGARAGADTALADGPPAVAESVVRALLTENGLDGTGATVVAVIDGAAPNQVLVVTVTASLSHPFDLVPSPDALTTTVAMRLDDQG